MHKWVYPMIFYNTQTANSAFFNKLYTKQRCEKFLVWSRSFHSMKCCLIRVLDFKGKNIHSWACYYYRINKRCLRNTRKDETNGKKKIFLSCFFLSHILKRLFCYFIKIARQNKVLEHLKKYMTSNKKKCF